MNNKMKKINEIIKSKPVQYIIVACAGLLVGWLLFSSSESPAPATHEGHEMHEGHSHDLVQDETGVWTCSMHPQIRQDKPGKCPICAMDLIPVRKGSGGGENSDPKAIQLSEEAAALADVQTSKVSRKNPGQDSPPVWQDRPERTKLTVTDSACRRTYRTTQHQFYR